MLREEAAAVQAADGSVSGRTAFRARAVVSWRALVAVALLSLVLGVAVFEGVAGERSSVAPAARPSGFSHEGLFSLPLAAQGPVSAAMGADSPAYRISASSGGFAAASPAQRLSLRFGRSGVSVSSGSTHARLSLQAVGYGTSFTAVEPVAPRPRVNGVVYARGDLSEWYANGPLGLEQGFTILRVASGRVPGPLTLSIALSGNVRASLASGGRGIILRHLGGASLRYSGLRATDAHGRLLPSWLELHAGRILLRVDARGAGYPLRIDPYVQQGEKLTVPQAFNENGDFGISVALSHDGNTALIGGPGHNNGFGAAWVFTRSGETWTQQGGELTGSGELGTYAGFGRTVALSADGDTALIGAPGDDNGVGAAWVFTRSGSTWTQQGEKLTGEGEVGEGAFGSSVALSSDGNTALIAGGRFFCECSGAAWVFTRSGETWTQEGPPLTGGEEIGGGSFGFSVALSADGNTALIGGVSDDEGDGAAWVFTRSGEEWSQQGPKLTGGGEAENGWFGFSVALSADGNTALIGSPEDDETGAAWVFTRSGEEWSQQGSNLTASGSVTLGSGVALSAEGNVALIGDEEAGSAWLFRRAEGSWTQQGETLSTGEEGSSCFGRGVALSSDANTALVGAYCSGAAWVFVNQPPSPPTVVTGVASSITAVSTELSATVNADGEAVSDCHFEYGTTTSYGSNAPCSPAPGAGGSLVAVSAAVTGLSADTTYHFRIVATNPTGSSYGGDQTFTTLPNPPTVVTGAASSITQTSATLNATVNPNGGAVSECQFEYGTSPSYGSNVPCSPSPGSGTNPVAVSASIEGLAANTTYHFRVVAINGGGNGYGSEREFTTQAGAPEFGRCVKGPSERVGSKTIYHGGFTGATCGVASGTHTGPYEWEPGVLRAHFTTTPKERPKVTLQTVKGSKVTCTDETSAGEYAGLQTVAGVTITFTGCTRSTEKCSSASAAPGEIATNPLEGALGVEKLGATSAKNKVGLALYPVGKTGPLMEFSCGGTTISVQGSVIVPVTADKMLLTVKLKAKAAKGEQIPESFVGEPKDILEAAFNGEPFEQVGLTLTTTQTNEEPVEVNSVV